MTFSSWARVLLSSEYRVKSGYNDSSLCDISSVTSDKFLKKMHIYKILNDTLISMLGFN